MKGLPAGRQGFTLFETLVAAAVAVIAGTLLVSILVNNTGLYNKQNALVATGLNVNDALNEIDTYVRQAASIASGYPEVSPTYTTGVSTLVLKVPAENSQGIINNTFDYVVITKNPTKTYLLYEYIFPDSLSTRKSQNKILTNILYSITFSYLDNNGATISPTSAQRIKTEISVLSQTGAVGNTRNATIITSLRNI